MANKMAYKSAGVKSKKELALRLMNGEVFYLADGDYKVFWDAEAIDSPFICDTGAITEELKGFWSLYEDMVVKAEWYENIPLVGALCWVSDLDEDCTVQTIGSYRHIEDGGVVFRELSSGGKEWKFATPVTKEELFEFED